MSGPVAAQGPRSIGTTGAHADLSGAALDRLPSPVLLAALTLVAFVGWATFSDRLLLAMFGGRAAPERVHASISCSSSR